MSNIGKDADVVNDKLSKNYVSFDAQLRFSVEILPAELTVLNRNLLSPYADVGPDLVAAGYPAIPLRAWGDIDRDHKDAAALRARGLDPAKFSGRHQRTKHPAAFFYGDNKFQRFAHALPPTGDVETWSEPGLRYGVGLVMGSIAEGVDVDTDDPRELELILSFFPPTPVAKRGGKGATLIYGGRPGVPKRIINIRRDVTDPETGEVKEKWEPLVEFLADGQQTVLPPSLHPTTGWPYEWLNPGDMVRLMGRTEAPASYGTSGGKTLLDVRPADLPKLWDTVAEDLTAFLQKAGLPVRLAGTADSAGERQGGRGNRQTGRGDGDDPSARAGHYPRPLTPEAETDLRALLAAIPPASLSPDEWETATRALKFWFDEDAWPLFDEWCQRDPDRYNAKENRKRWDSFKRDGSGGKAVNGPGALFMIAERFGYHGKVRDSFTQEREARATRRGKGGNGGGSLSQGEVARRFRDEFQGRFKHCDELGGWHVWNGSHWERGDSKTPARAMLELVERINADEKGGSAEKNQTARFVKDALYLASLQDGIAVTEKAFDTDPFLLATPGGTVDLRTGELREARPDDLITRCTSVAPGEPGADCPLWREFLAFALRDDPELIRFVRQWAGYALSGDVREQKFAFLYGSGGNGKGVFLNALLGIMGGYSAQINAATVMSGASDRHLTEVASLRGIRFAVAPEVTAGREWDAERIKTMSGGDKLRARFMRQDEFEFMPEFKLTVSGNHQPILRNVDEAMRRRMRLVPFTRKPAKADGTLPERLKAEWPAVLRWMIDGCLDWQENGLILPAAVDTATASYFEAQDIFGEWLMEHCEIDPERPDWFTSSGDLLTSYNDHRSGSGERPVAEKSLADPLQHAGAVRGKNKEKTKRGYRFIRLKEQPVDIDP